MCSTNGIQIGKFVLFDLNGVFWIVLIILLLNLFILNSWSISMALSVLSYLIILSLFAIDCWCVFKYHLQLVAKHNRDKEEEYARHNDTVYSHYSVVKAWTEDLALRHLVTPYTLDSDWKNCVGSCQKHINYEQQEVFQIVKAYAIIYPRAMMVHSNHTSIAYAAVMRPWWF